MPAFAVVKISLQIRACKQRLPNSACQCDPVCPLVHNGMQKFATFAQGDWECTAFLPESVLAALWDTGMHSGRRPENDC